MANIMDLFSQAEVVDVNFDITKAQGIYERIKKAQDSVGGRPRLKAKIGGGGAKIFTFVYGNKDMVVEKFRGVIIAHHKCNALFKAFDNEPENMNTPPICSSVDGITGIDYETGECRHCETCPHNDFGTSVTGKGKACKNMHRLYILIEGSPIPVTLSLPPTSLELWRNYAIMDVASAGLDMSEVVTEFSLSNAVTQNGTKYSIVNFKCVGKVDDTVKEFCINMGNSIESTPRLAIAPDEYNREAVNALEQSDEAPTVIEQADEELDDADFETDYLGGEITGVSADEVDFDFL